MSGVLLQLLSLSLSAPVARDSTTRRSVFRQGKRRYEVPSGHHLHDLPGEVHWLITNGTLETTSALRAAGIIDNRYAVLNGSYVVSAKDAPKLTLLWGSTGGNVNWPDLRDRYLVGYGNLRDSGVDDGLAFGAARTDRMRRIHGHVIQPGGSHSHTGKTDVSDGNANTTRGTGTTATVGSGHAHVIPAQADHNHTGNVDNSISLSAPSIGAVPVVRIQ